MNDLELAKDGLTGHTICLCKDGKCLYSEEKGIKPMINFISNGTVLQGYSVADLVVGKAAALLFVKSGIVNVFAKVLSQSGKQILDEFGIHYEYEKMVEKIINRLGTDICPMEKTVMNTNNPDVAYDLLFKKINNLNN